jgi:hypothetical protein
MYSGLLFIEQLFRHEFVTNTNILFVLEIPNMSQTRSKDKVGAVPLNKQ